jgi:hypothetical protein
MSWAEKRRFAVAALLFLALATQTALGSYGQAAGVWITSVSLVAGAVLLRNRQWEPVALLAAAAATMRFGFLFEGFSDQITVAQAAGARALGGLNPYGVGYAESSPPGAPFPYGPLALLWWQPGPVVELVAAMGLLALLAWQRAFITLAVLGGWQAAVHTTTMGANDYSPAVLVVLGLIVLRTNRYAGGCLLAAAAALKPYAFAWFVPATGFGGVTAAVALVSTTVVLWTPVLFVWGVASFLESIRQASALPHHVAGTHSLNMPALRILALPLEIAGLWTRRWEYCLLIGSGVFIIVMFLAQWATYSYWIAVIPPTGLALESLWQGQFEERRRNSS